MKEIVLFITDFFGPNPGGIENFHTGIVKKWMDDQLILICFDNLLYIDEKELKQFNESLKHNIYRFSLKKSDYISKKKVIKEFLSLFEQIKKNYKIKHIILGNISLITRLTIPYILDSSIPYSIILHPIDLEILSFYKWNLLKLIRNAKQIFVYTNYFYEVSLIKGIPRELLIQIPIGLFIQWDQNNLKVSQSLKASIQKNKSKIKILTVGPLSKNRKIERVVFVLEHLQKLINLENIHWYILGTGSEYHYIKELIEIYGFSSCITLTGFLNNKEIGYMYYNSDIYYHPGGKKGDIFSGFSTTLLEAGFCSMAIISGSGAAVDEIIQNNISGFIFPNEDYENISFKLKELIEDPELRKKIGRMSEERMVREFSIERSVLNIYERIYI